jgi:hypothetical protein
MSSSSGNHYLTELILAIHNDIQSAVDYIAESAQQEGTELGKSPAVMNIESLRVRLPIKIDLEQKQSSARISSIPTTLEKLRSTLAARKGFMIDKGQAGKLALFTKIKVISIDNTQSADNKGLGEIEIQFAPLRRE